MLFKYHKRKKHLMNILLVDDKQMIPVMTCAIQEIARFMGLQIKLVGVENCTEARDLLPQVDVIIIDLFSRDRQVLAAFVSELSKPTIIMHSLHDKTCPADTRTLRFMYKLEWDVSRIGQALMDFENVLATRKYHEHLSKVIAHGLVYPNPLN